MHTFFSFNPLIQNLWWLFAIFYSINSTNFIFLLSGFRPHQQFVIPPKGTISPYFPVSLHIGVSGLELSYYGYKKKITIISFLMLK